MRLPRPDLRRLLTAERLAWAGAAALALVAALTYGWWGPAAEGLIAGTDPAAAGEAAEDPHAGHDHGAHEDRGDEPYETIRLSEQARGTLGLRTAEVTVSDFTRHIEVPAVVAAIPGRTSLRVPAPMTGVLTDVFVTEGQAVEPGDPLFVLRLTHEDVVRAQTDYLTTLEALDVEDREIARLEAAGSGVVARKVVLEREYERQKLAGLLKAQRQALLLHGLTDAQIAGIRESRNLVREVRIEVPRPHDPTDPGHDERHDLPVTAAALRRPATAAQEGAAPPEAVGRPEPVSGAASPAAPLTVAHLHARPGEAVEAGAELVELHDLRRLYIEGRAFAADAEAVTRAARQDRPVTAIPADGLLTPDGDTGGALDAGDDDGDADDPYGAAIPGLQILHVANDVNPDSRTLPFYVGLPNTILRDGRLREGGGFVTWKYKPGQRMRVRVPVGRYEGVIVLPARAVTESGAERFVFVENGSTFEQRPVRVRYRDGERVVIADDGSVLPGESVAVTAAYQLRMALKNQAGGAPDPHAGHNH
ncbi:efflux RND transporter periplasmic adaptor subunit [Alienimonas sp. DA493]|uniref:efflux RND transporter periplasmic adaptor subunit n=1 Tax=Alienimonas sp. DA493 TaxID=3373605 RepID=UPI00375538AF